MNRRLGGGALWLLLLAMLAGCVTAPRAGVASGPGGSCAPYGAVTPPPWGDPVLGAPQPTPTRDLRPTCTPWPTPVGATATPAPTPTARPQTAAPSISTSPQNLTLSPGQEAARGAALGAGLAAVTWGGAGGNFVALHNAWGTRSWPTQELLGIDAPAAVAISPAGRLHVAGGGAYTYSGDGGLTWAAPVAAPGSDAPGLVVEGGYARLFWRVGDTLYTARQETAGWGAVTPLAAGVYDYAAMGGDSDAETVVAVVGAGYARVLWLATGRAVELPASGARQVRLTRRGDELTVGLGGAAEGVLWRAPDGGYAWQGCQIAATGYGVGAVAGFPTAQGPTAALWVWEQPFSYVALATVYWLPGGGCSVSPEAGVADALLAAGGGPPGLFALRTSQTAFQIAANGEFIVLTAGGDVYTAWLNPDGLLSAPSWGPGQPGEEAP